MLNAMSYVRKAGLLHYAKCVATQTSLLKASHSKPPRLGRHKIAAPNSSRRLTHTAERVFDTLRVHDSIVEGAIV